VSDKPGSPDPEHAFDPTKHDALAEAIKKLSPEEAAFFLWKLEISVRKRKLQLTGYLAAMLIWLVGMVAALVIYGTSDGFVGYVFLFPFALVGVTLWAFGKWAERVSAQKPPTEMSIKGISSGNANDEPGAASGGGVR
jgi:hypothetical protein